MKKAKTLLGLLMISGLLITGCDKEENKIVNNNETNDVNENNENGNNSDSGNENNSEENNESGNSGENNNESENSGSESGNENQSGNEGGNGNEYTGENNNGNENNGSEGGNENQGGNEGGNENGGGNTSNEKTTWDDEEKNVFDEYFYQIEVPYLYFPEEETIAYYGDELTAFKYGEQCTGALLETYAELFDESWLDYSNYEKHYYFFEKHLTTEEGLRIIAVEFYAVDDEFTQLEDGNGHLNFMVYEPYDYEWPDYFFEDFYEYYELTSTVPEFLEADYYEIDTSYMEGEDAIDGFAIYCYTDSLTAEEDYLALLTEADYAVVYADEDSGVVFYGKDGGDIIISFGYDPEYKSLDILVIADFSNADFEGDNLTAASFTLAEDSEDEYKPYSAVGETTGVEYNAVICKDTGIQLAKKDGVTSGIVSKTSGGLLIGVSIIWNENTAANQEVLIYASNEAFEIADMYDEESTKCECVGSILNDNNGDAFYFEEDYTYIGLRSNKGTVYLDGIFVAWADGGNGGQVDPYDPNKVDWSNEEKAEIANNFNGAELPYKNIENESFIRYNSETGFATKTAPNCSGELLASYAELFDDSWEDYSDLSGEAGYIYYCFEKVLNTDEGIRHVFVRFYGGTYDAEYGDYAPSLDGSGTFVLEVYNPFIYSWPTDFIEEFQELYELSDEVPSFEGADYYQIDDMWYPYFVGIFCYADEEAYDTYTKALTDAGYVLYDTDDYGYMYYAKEDGDTSVCIGYDEEYGTLDVYIEVYEVPEIPDGLELEGDELTFESFGLTEGSSEYGTHTAVGESGAEYSGNMAASYGIQLRNKNEKGKYSGIVVTKSGGTIEAIGFEFNNHTTSERTISIYASNEPFTVEDMYKGNVTKVGEVDNTYDVAIFDEFTDDYAYVGILVNKGAAYFDKIVFAWSSQD